MFITTNSDKILPGSSGIYFDTENNEVEFYKNGQRVEQSKPTAKTVSIGSNEISPYLSTTSIHKVLLDHNNALNELLDNNTDFIDGIEFNETTITQDDFYEENTNYIIKNTVTLSGSDEIIIPKNCTLYFVNGILTSNSSCTLVGHNTKIVAKCEQIFSDKIDIDGDWDCQARPEWFGGRADGIDYGSWPVRIYGTILTTDVNIETGMPQDYSNDYPADPDIYFNPIVYDALYEQGLAHKYNALNVCYDTNRECFLFNINNGNTSLYYSIWNNSNEWNDYSDPDHPKARRDCVFISSSEINGRTFGSTSGTQTVAHIFKYMEDGETGATVLRPAFIDEITYDDNRIPFQKAIKMGQGNVILQKDGVYTFKTIGNNNSYINFYFDKIDKDIIFEGNGATLFFLPNSSDKKCFWVNNIPNDNIPNNDAQYKIQNLKFTTIKGFKTDDSSSYVHPDCTSSFLVGFWIQRGHYITIENMSFLNMHEDFDIRWSSNLSVPGKQVNIKNWKSRNASQPLYFGTGTLQVIVDNADIVTRRYGQYGHHIFYLNYGSATATRKTSVICKNSKIIVPDGFMDVLIDARAQTDTNEYMNKGWSCELYNCTIEGPQLGSFGPGINYILDNVRFFKNSDIVMNNTISAPRTIDYPYIIRKGMAAPGHIKLSNCTFECDNYGLITNKKDNHLLQDSLVIEYCSVKSDFRKDAYNSGTKQKLNGNDAGIINVRGNVEIKNSSFNTPYSPLITLGNLTRKMHCTKFIIENNIALCSGYFLYAFNVNTTSGSSISNNIVNISKDIVDRASGKVGPYSAMYMAALVAGYNEAGSDLKNVAIGYNNMITVQRTFPTGVTSASILDTAITSGIRNENYIMYTGNTIDGTAVGPENQQIQPLSQ